MERSTARTAGVAPVVISGGPTFSQPTTLAGVFEALAGGARIVAGGTDLVVGTRQGKWTMPDAPRGDRPGRGAARHPRDRRRRPLAGRARLARRGRNATPRSASGSRPLPTPRRSSDRARRATSARSAATSSTRRRRPRPSGRSSASVPFASLRSAGGERRVPVADLATGPGRTVLAPGEVLVGVEVPAPAAGTASCYARLEYRRQMEIAVVGATAVVTVTGGRDLGRADRDHGARTDDPARPRGRGGAERVGRRPRGRRAGRPAAAAAAARSTTSAPPPTTAARWPP